MTDKDKTVDETVEETVSTEEPKTEEATVEEAPVVEEPTAEEPTTSAPADTATPAAGSDQQGRQMYDVKCSACGKDTQVPFQPSGDRPVYCRECYMKNKSR